MGLINKFYEWEWMMQREMIIGEIDLWGRKIYENDRPRWIGMEYTKIEKDKFQAEKDADHDSVEKQYASVKQFLLYYYAIKDTAGWRDYGAKKCGKNGR